MDQADHETNNFRAKLIHHGCVRWTDETRTHLTPLPAMRHPFSLGRDLFSHGRALAALFNALLDRIVCNPEWLLEKFKQIRKADDFVDKHCKIVETVYMGPNAPKRICESLRGYVTRSDYMTSRIKPNQWPFELKQVELNAGCVLGPAMMEGLSAIHNQEIQPEAWGTRVENEPLTELARSLVSMVEHYRIKTRTERPVCVLIVTDKFEANDPEIEAIAEKIRSFGEKAFIAPYEHLLDTCGEECIESCGFVPLKVETNMETETAKKTETETAKKTETETGNEDIRCLNPSGKQSFSFRPFHCDCSCAGEPCACDDNCTCQDECEHDYETAVVYFRSCYSPTHFNSEAHWKLREDLEASRAITIPSAISWLAGFKRIQQVMSDIENFKFFKFTAAEIDLFRTVICDQVLISDKDCPKTSELIQEAREHPDRFLLKPQREGGNNNLFDKDMLPKLDCSEEGWILMRKIKPEASVRPMLTKEGKMDHISAISELGFFAAALYDGSVALSNRYIGYLVRTKKEDTNEGGICVGASYLDSFYIH